MIPLIPYVKDKFHISFPIIPPNPISALFFLMDLKTRVNSSTLVTNAMIIKPKNASLKPVKIIIFSADIIKNSPPISIKQNPNTMKFNFFCQVIHINDI